WRRRLLWRLSSRSPNPPAPRQLHRRQPFRCRPSIRQRPRWKSSLTGRRPRPRRRQRHPRRPLFRPSIPSANGSNNSLPRSTASATSPAAATWSNPADSRVTGREDVGLTGQPKGGSRFASRVARVRDAMRAAQLDAFVVTHAPNVQYLTGLRASAGFVLLTPDSCTLVVDFRYV